MTNQELNLARAVEFRHRIVNDQAVREINGLSAYFARECKEVERRIRENDGVDVTLQAKVNSLMRWFKDARAGRIAAFEDRKGGGASVTFKTGGRE